MSNTDDDGLNNSAPVLPENKVEKILEQMQFLSLKQGKSTGFDMSKFNEGQVDKLLDLLAKNEENAFKYHTKRLDSAKSITEKRIDASIVDQKTFRYALIAIIIVFCLTTVLILIYKSDFFIPWLTFLTGLAGGFGIGKIKTDKVAEKAEDDRLESSEG